MPTTEITVKKVRKHFAAWRTVERNIRLGRYTGRNSMATAIGQGHHAGQAEKLLDTLPTTLASLLRTEHELAKRISENKDLWGTERPELKARLNAARSEIKALCEQDSHYPYLIVTDDHDHASVYQINLPDEERVFTGSPEDADAWVAGQRS